MNKKNKNNGSSSLFNCSDKEKDSEFDFLNKYKTWALIALGIVVCIFFAFRQAFGLSFGKIDSIGVIGDFFGGLLNPLFALIGLFALLATIKIQSKALKVSSKELKLTRKEARDSAKALKKQSDSLKQQNFENTFFNMINLHNEIVKMLMLKAQSIDSSYSIGSETNNSHINLNFSNPKDSFSKESISTLLKNFKDFQLNNYENIHLNHSCNILIKVHPSVKDIIDNKDDSTIYKSPKIDKLTENKTNNLYLIFHNEYQIYFGHYFRNIYQILKYIHESNIHNDYKKQYSNILRALFSKDELEFLYYNCISSIGNEKFLLLLNEYEFLEHLPYDDTMKDEDLYFCINRIKRLPKELSETSTSFCFDFKLFGSSTYWRDAVSRIN